MTTTFAANIRKGDYVRDQQADDPNFREVIRVEQDALGYVNIEVAVGAMVERLRPLHRSQHIEVER